ncbi:MAG: hypothetical protein R6U55_17020 [Desulfovermiculus sp.]
MKCIAITVLVATFLTPALPTFASDELPVGSGLTASQSARMSATDGDELPVGSGLTAEALVRVQAGTDSMFDTTGNFSELAMQARYDAPEQTGLYAGLDFRAINDDTYGVSSVFLGIPYYFLIREAGVGYEGSPLSGRAGRFPHSDVVESPYSLFVSSREQSAFLYELDYQGDWLRFLTRSVELNRNSDIKRGYELGYPDRSVVFQTVAITREHWEFGFQDSTVAVPAKDSAVVGVNDGESELERAQTSDGSGPLFVPDLFFSPLPGFLTQYILGSGDNPWRQDINYNSLMGFYGVVRGDGADLPWQVESQILVDDFNANAFFNPSAEQQNPFMIGWMVSGRIDTDLGRFRLSHAGSTMYTFQDSQDRNYSYTYYPEISFPLNDEGDRRTLDYRDNYFGFYLGENTLALRLDWERDFDVAWGSFDRLDAGASLEYTVSGTKSPANQWGDYSDWKEHGNDWPAESTRLLDESTLEHGLSLSTQTSISRPLGGAELNVGLTGDLGVWFNVLEQDAAGDGGPSPRDDLYRPSDRNYILGQAGVFARMSY